MSERLNTELPSTLLFDHPSLRSIADSLSVYDEAEEVLEPKFETAQEPRYLMQRPQRAKAQSTTAVVETISSTLSDILGTRVATDAPLMSVGLDSIAATELTNALAERFDTELPQTLMFDHPTIDAMASFIAETTEMSVAAVTVEREAMPTTTMAMAVMTSRQDAPDRVFLASRQIRCTIPGGCHDPPALKELGLRAWTANSHWPVSRLAAVELQGTSAAYGAFLAPDAFAADAAFFGISRTEARAMDPMAMLVLATTYGALSDSSSNARAKLANAPIGFFLGAGGIISGTGGGTASPPGAKRAPSVYSATSGALSVLSGRLSYTLGLTGPCQTTDTACSSSLVAAHQAVSALKLGESPAAAVAGVMVLTVPVSVAFSAAGMLSALGRCHTFDRRADGYCRGEGCGAFYFSTEADDVAVSGTAVQQDGPSASLTAPNGSSQQRLIEAVEAGNGPSLEAHGTGTALGDPIEVGAATRALCKGRERGSAAIQCTSLKSNMGHLEPAAAAAGLASLVVGPLMASVVAVNAQLRGLNAHLSSIVSSKPFQMPVDVAPRTTALSGSRLSSFGFSGTIAHGAFEARKTIVSMSNDSKSLYRGRRFITSSETTRLDWLLEAPGPQEPRPDEAVVFSGALSPSALLLFSHHVVGGTIILPGVGYVEMAFAASSSRALTAVAFLRPCVLPEPGRGEKCVLRCRRRATGALEIASGHSENDGSFVVHFIGSQDSTHDAVSLKSTNMLTTTKDRHEFLRTEGKSKDEPGTFEYRDFGSGQKRIGLPVYEAVTSWSDEVAQTQEMESLVPQHVATNKLFRLSWSHGEIEEHSQSCQSSSEIVVQLLSISQSPDTVVIVQHEGNYASIRSLREGKFDGRPPSIVGSLTPMGRCSPLVPTSKPMHVVESYEAMNRSVVQKNVKATNKRTSALGRARSKKIDVAGVVEKTVKTLLGTDVPDDAPLMGAGLDSLSAVDLVQTLGQELGTELEPTALFDYPTIGSLSKYLTAEIEPVDVTVPPSSPAASTKPRMKVVDVSGVVQKTVEELLGTVVPNDAPLMGAGLDSLSAVDLVQTLGQRLDTELEPTALFDYPTIVSLSKYLDEQMEPEIEPAQKNTMSIPSQLEAEDKAIQECFVVATAMCLPTVECSFTNGDLHGLSHGRYETATHVPATRWNMDSIDTRRFSADARSRVRYGSFLQSDFSMFDNTMFRISPAEARPLEPQQRMLLEVGYEALHRQGQNRSTLVDSDTGIFTGMMNMDAQYFVPSVPGPYDMTGITYSAAGARLSYVFAMRGPCMVFDTACSSSLIAMHAARRSMQHNECPLALTIGPNAILHPSAHVGPALTGMTSIRGRCHTFDARADGYLRGEGCGAVVLETEQRGNHVSCLGSSARHNGQSATFTALNGLSQQLLIKAALSDASTTIGTVMEAHGTGTGLGDPIEISSISAIVKKSGHKSCSVCAIKGNVGHTESTAGVANVIEVIGLLKLGEMALNVQLRTLNPQVRQVRAEVLHSSVDTNPMYRGKTQTGGASSFGWSGIIAHGVFRYERSGTTKSEERTLASASLYRNSLHLVRRSDDGPSRLRWLAVTPEVRQSLTNDAVIFSGALAPATVAFLSHHVVGGSILLPGVSFIEMAFAASPGHASLTAIAYLRPCSLPSPTDRSGERCVLRCMQRGAALEIASQRIGAK